MRKGLFKKWTKSLQGQRSLLAASIVFITMNLFRQLSFCVYSMIILPVECILSRSSPIFINFIILLFVVISNNIVLEVVVKMIIYIFDPVPWNLFDHSLRTIQGQNLRQTQHQHQSTSSSQASSILYSYILNHLCQMYFKHSTIWNLYNLNSDLNVDSIQIWTQNFHPIIKR